MRLCVQCSHYIGCGDWDLCCNQQEKRLCYEDTPADDCPKFHQTTLCKNHSSYVGMFRCTICGYFDREANVDKECPNCGNTIRGAMWRGQKHFDCEEA